MKYYLGIDLGGTNIAVGVVDEQYRLLQKRSAPTPTGEDYNIIADAIKEVSLALLSEMNISTADVECAGIGTPGQVNPETGYVVFACNLHMRNAPLGIVVSEKLGIKTFLCNDADAAAFGEAEAGVAKGTRSSVTITLGTGVGCGVVLGTTIIPGEGGHMIIRYGGEPCNCGRVGCFESYASASALIRQTKAAMEQDKNSLMWKVAEASGKVNGRTVFDAMRQGDSTAKAVVEQYVDYVACGIINICNLFQPEMVCIGGGISGEGESLISLIRERVQKEQYPLPDGSASKVEVCRLGNDAGIIGAALFGKYM
ncbi:MAG: ROK family protein [Angelakisella sp.]